MNRRINNLVNQAFEDRNLGVSVCICHYNMGETIYKCLNSLNTLLTRNDEIILVDDGSNLAHLNRLNKAIKGIDFICTVKVIKKQRSVYRKLGSVRNLSINAASKKVVVLHLDADDIFSDKLKTNIKLYYLLSVIIGDVYVSGSQLQIVSKKLIKRLPYQNIYYGEDRILWSTLIVAEKILFVKHKEFRRRIPLTRSKKLIKSFILLFCVFRDELRVTNSGFITLINLFNKLKRPYNFGRKFLFIIQLFMFPLAWLGAKMNGSYKGDILPLAQSSKIAADTRKSLEEILFDNNFTEGEIDILLKSMFSKEEIDYLLSDK